jgi:PPOX class probable F420-dependent enzyme
MEPMTPSEWRTFLLSGTRTAKLATVRVDGRPHVVPIWFILDGDTLVFTTFKDTIKGKKLQRDPRVMLCVDDESPPFAFVFIEGRVTASELPLEELVPWTTRIAARYMGDAQAGAYGKRNAVPGELLVRVPLEKVTARKGIAD